MISGFFRVCRLIPVFPLLVVIYLLAPENSRHFCYCLMPKWHYTISFRAIYYMFHMKWWKEKYLLIKSDHKLNSWQTDRNEFGGYQNQTHCGDELGIERNNNNNNKNKSEPVRRFLIVMNAYGFPFFIRGPIDCSASVFHAKWSWSDKIRQKSSKYTDTTRATITNQLWTNVWKMFLFVARVTRALHELVQPQNASQQLFLLRKISR